jgi:lipopolysaccharide export system protein LptA
MFKRFIVRSSALALLAASVGLGAQQAPAEAPIVIDSVNNEYDLRNGLTRFYDDVSIQRGSMKVSADEGVVRQADGEIVSIELRGNPTTWEDRLEDGSLVQGEAQRIHFAVQENVITLTAGARIRHEQGEFTGDELIYDLDTENLVGRGSADNRARVVIEPEAMRRGEIKEPPADNSTDTSADPDSDAANDTTTDPGNAAAAAPESAGAAEDAVDAAAASEADSADAAETPAEDEDPIDPPDAG